jgi:molybdopterin converting factor small subunit
MDGERLAVAAILVLPAALRRHCADRPSAPLAPGPLRAALEKLCGDHPMLGRCLFDDAGNVRAFVRMYLNGEDIRHAAGLDSVLADGDTVQVTVAVAGG